MAVVILNWNGHDFLRRFLPAVLAHSDGAAVFVADNASTDDSVAVVRAEFPAVRLIQNSGNLGFCEGYNQALAQLGPEFRYYVLLNSDVEVTPGWLRPQRELLAANATMAACQPKIRQYSPEPALRQQFEYAGAGGGYLDSLGYPFCRGRLFDTLETDTGQYDDPRPVAWATGACMLVRAEAWHALDGLEPTFFAHMEEIDLCWRLQNAGWQVWYHGGCTVFHVGGGTLHKSNPRKTYLNFRNGLALVFKNTHPAEPGRRHDRPRGPRLGGGPAPAHPGPVGRLLGGAAGPQALPTPPWLLAAAAAAVPARLRLSERPGTYAGSLVWSYFGQGKKRFSEL